MLVVASTWLQVLQGSVPLEPSLESSELAPLNLTTCVRNTFFRLHVFRYRGKRTLLSFAFSSQG